METERGTAAEVPAFSPGQRRVLDALGVPLYVRRALWPIDVVAVESKAAAHPSADPAAPPARTARESPRRDAPGSLRQAPGAAVQTPRYALSFAQLGGGVLVCDRSGRPTGHFARDIALALGSDVRAPAVSNLEWPGQLPASLAADPVAAREAARGLLDGMLDGVRGGIVLLLGEQAVAQLVVPHLGDVAAEGQAEVAGNRWYWNVGAYQLAATKRALWRFLCGVNAQS